MIKQETGLTLCRWWCAAPRIPCWPPQGRCRFGRCQPLHQALSWLQMTLPPGHSQPPQRTTRMLQLHLSSSCSFSPHRPLTGPNTGSGTHEHPGKHCDMHGLNWAQLINLRGRLCTDGWQIKIKTNVSAYIDWSAHTTGYKRWHF